MKRKRILSITLALLLALTIIPQTGMTALADSGDPALVSGGSALSKGANTNGAQILNYGGRPWYVISHADGSAWLLSKGNIGHTKYDPENYRNAYGTSTLKKKVEEVKNGFDSRELAAVTPRNLEGGGKNKGQDGYDKNKISGDAVSGAHLWPLSVAEAETVDSDLRKADPEHTGSLTSPWWLRSPGSLAFTAGVVAGDGDVLDDGDPVDIGEFGVRPAFNLNLSSVIFTSAAAGGKSSGAVGASALKAQSSEKNTGNEWKVTIKDEAHAKFAIVPCDTGYNSATGEATVSYKGAQTETGEYISAVIKNTGGTITYYGRIAASASETGTVTINTSGKIQSGDKLYVFNEQYHDNTATDYASELKEIPLQPSPGHDLAKTAAKEETCTEAGNSEYWTCEKCGKFFDDDAGVIEIAKDSWIIPAGHKMSYHNAVPATCTEDGNVEYYACGNCNKNFSDEQGSAELDTIVDPKTGHNMTHHAAVASTCTEDGTVEYWACGNCNKNFSDEQGSAELDTIVDPKTGHDYGKWTKLNDTQHQRVCAHDSAHIEKEDHKWDDGKISTGGTRSLTLYTCTVCKATKEVVNEGKTYQLSSGANGSWTKGSTSSLGFTFKSTKGDSETFDHFSGIEIDGKTVPEKDASGNANWTKKKGSVIIELQPSYLETLSVGKHKLTASFDDGDDVTTEFTVKAKAATPTKTATASGKNATSSPNTGDESNMLFWFMMICVSLLVMFLIIPLRNRRYYDR